MSNTPAVAGLPRYIKYALAHPIRASFAEGALVAFASTLWIKNGSAVLAVGVGVALLSWLGWNRHGRLSRYLERPSSIEEMASVRQAIVGHPLRTSLVVGTISALVSAPAFFSARGTGAGMATLIVMAIGVVMVGWTRWWLRFLHRRDRRV